MARSGQFKVYVKADVNDVNRGLASVEKSMKGLQATGKRLGTLTKGLGLAAGVVGFSELTQGVKSTIAAFTDSEKIARQTGAVLKSTSGAANITAKEVSALADSISRKTAVDDEAIASAENLLLTFTSVRNEAGKGNDIFNQATATIVDMSAALGQDLKSSSIQVGKALNDPVKGITALSRVGVSFTQQQKDQIKTLTESGDTLGAQKIILKELNKEFAGSAASQKTPFAAFKVAAENLQETLGGYLAPAAAAAATALTGLINGAQTGTGLGGQIADGFRSLVGVFQEVGSVAASVVGFFADNEAALTALAMAVAGATAAFIAFKAVTTVMALFFVIKAAVLTLAAAFVTLRTAIMTNPFVAVAVGAVALGAALVVLYQRSETFRNIVNTAFNAVKSVAIPVFNVLKTAASAVGSALARAFQAAQPAIRIFVQVVKTYFRLAAAEFRLLVSIAKTVFSAIGSVVRAAATVIGALIKALVTSVKTIWGGLKILVSVAKTIFSGIAAAVKTYLAVASAAVRAAVRAMKSVWDGISSLASKTKSVMSSIVSAIKAIISTAGAAAKSVINAVIKAFSGITKIVSKVTSAGADAISRIRGWGSKFYSAAFEAGKRIVEAIVRAVSELPSKLGSIGAKAAGALKSGVSKAGGKALDLVGLASGGRVDSAQLAVVGEGNGPEYIIPTDPALRKSRGLPLLMAAADEMGVLMYAKGGKAGKKKKKGAKKRYKPSYEQKLAENEIDVNESEGTLDTTADDIAALKDRKKLLSSRLKTLKSRMRSTKKKMKGKISAATRKNLKERLLAYTSEAASVQSEINSIVSKLTDLASTSSSDDSSYSDSSYETEASTDSSTTSTDSSTDDTADLQAQLEQAELKAYVAQRSSALSDAFIKTALSPGDISSGGSSALTVNIQSLVPSDSSTLSTVAQYVAAALGTQGSVSSSTVTVGV